MTLENPIDDESHEAEQESNNHANAVARQLRMANDELLEEIGVDPEDHFTRASELDDSEEGSDE